MSAPKLLPCPFCGSAATIHDAGDKGEPSYWSVQCSGCHGHLDHYFADGSEDGAEAIAAWNRRSAPPASAGEPRETQQGERERLARSMADILDSMSYGIGGMYKELKWYADQAEAMGRYFHSRPVKSQGVEAVTVALALDGGKRARAALRASPPAGQAVQARDTEAALAQTLDEMETAATVEPLSEHDKGFNAGVRYAVAHIRGVLHGRSAPAGHTDLMVSPESLNEYIYQELRREVPAGVVLEVEATRAEGTALSGAGAREDEQRASRVRGQVPGGDEPVRGTEGYVGRSAPGQAVQAEGEPVAWGVEGRSTYPGALAWYLEDVDFEENDAVQRAENFRRSNPRSEFRIVPLYRSASPVEAQRAPGERQREAQPEVWTRPRDRAWASDFVADFMAGKVTYEEMYKQLLRAAPEQPVSLPQRRIEVSLFPEAVSQLEMGYSATVFAYQAAPRVPAILILPGSSTGEETP